MYECESMGKCIYVCLWMYISIGMCMYVCLCYVHACVSVYTYEYL